MTDTPNENARIIARIEAAWPRMPEPDGSNEDRNVLGYIAEALRPDAIARRDEEERDVRHLHAVAKTRLKPYERASDA
jgi:hypothetical protein